jgi:hypothetical protein
MQGPGGCVDRGPGQIYDGFGQFSQAALSAQTEVMIVDVTTLSQTRLINISREDI